MVADLGVIVRQQVRWRAEMDQIRPFYAVKSNSSPVVIEILAALGTGFVCSNKVNIKYQCHLLSLKLDCSVSQNSNPVLFLKYVIPFISWFVCQSSVLAPCLSA